VILLRVYRASNVWVDRCGSGCHVIQLQPAEVSRKVTSSFQRSWTVNVNANEGIQARSRQLNSVQFTCNSTMHYPCTVKCSALDVRIIGSVCGLSDCPTVRLNCSWSSVPPGTHPRCVPYRDRAGYKRLLGVRCEVKTRGACTYEEESKGEQHHLRGNQGSRERANNVYEPHSSNIRQLYNTVSIASFIYIKVNHS
jgi:hypothetical protein